MKSGLEEFLKRIEAKPTNETLIDRFMTLVLEEEGVDRILYLKNLVGLLLKANPYAALKAAYVELQEARKGELNHEYEIGALKDVESCFLNLGKTENAAIIREEISKLQLDYAKSKGVGTGINGPAPLAPPPSAFAATATSVSATPVANPAKPSTASAAAAAAPQGSAAQAFFASLANKVKGGKASPPQVNPQTGLNLKPTDAIDLPGQIPSSSSNTSPSQSPSTSPSSMPANEGAQHPSLPEATSFSLKASGNFSGDGEKTGESVPSEIIKSSEQDADLFADSLALRNDEADEIARIEEEARARVEAEERSRIESEALAQALAEEEARLEAEAKALAEAEAKAALEAKAAAEAKAKADEEARLKAEAEAEAEAKARAEQEAKEREREKAEAEAEALRLKAAEEEARLKAEAEAKAKAEEEARLITEAKAKAEEEARRLAEAEAKAKADAEAKVKAEAKAKLEAEAKARAESEMRAKLVLEAKAKAEAEVRAKAEAKAKAKTEAPVKITPLAIPNAADEVSKIFSGSVPTKTTANAPLPVPDTSKLNNPPTSRATSDEQFNKEISTRVAGSLVIGTAQNKVDEAPGFVPLMTSVAAVLPSKTPDRDHDSSDDDPTKSRKSSFLLESEDDVQVEKASTLESAAIAFEAKHAPKPSTSDDEVEEDEDGDGEFGLSLEYTKRNRITSDTAFDEAVHLNQAPPESSIKTARAGFSLRDDQDDLVNYYSSSSGVDESFEPQPFFQPDDDDEVTPPPADRTTLVSLEKLDETREQMDMARDSSSRIQGVKLPVNSGPNFVILDEDDDTEPTVIEEPVFGNDDVTIVEEMPTSEASFESVVTPSQEISQSEPRDEGLAENESHIGIDISLDAFDAPPSEDKENQDASSATKVFQLEADLGIDDKIEASFEPIVKVIPLSYSDPHAKDSEIAREEPFSLEPTKDTKEEDITSPAPSPSSSSSPSPSTEGDSSLPLSSSLFEMKEEPKADVLSFAEAPEPTRSKSTLWDLAVPAHDESSNGDITPAPSLTDEPSEVSRGMSFNESFEISIHRHSPPPDSSSLPAKPRIEEPLSTDSLALLLPLLEKAKEGETSSPKKLRKTLGLDEHWVLLKVRLERITGFESGKQALTDFVKKIFNAKSETPPVQKLSLLLTRFLGAESLSEEVKIEISSWMFEDLDPGFLHELFQSMNLKEELVDLYLDHIELLSDRHQHRLALSLMHDILRFELDESWYVRSYPLLEKTWENLGLEGWHWVPEEGGAVFCDRLARREEPSLATLLA